MDIAITVAITVAGFTYMVRSTNRTFRIIAALIVQESEKVQRLLKEA